MSTIAITQESPMPTFKHHPIKVLSAKLKQVGISAVAGHVGIFAVVALYYLAFQTIPAVKEFWDHLLTTHIHLLANSEWETWRHLLRNVGEYFLGTLLVMQVLINPFKFRNLKKPNLLDRIELALHIPNIKQRYRVTTGQLLTSPLVALIYAIPGFVLGALIMLEIRHLAHLQTLAPYLGAHPSFVAKIYAGEFDQHIVGIIAGIFMGRRPMRKVMLDIQHFFAERRVAKGKKNRFYHPLPFEVLVDCIREEHGQDEAIQRQAHLNIWVPVIMVGGLTVLIALAGFGYYVLQYIAK